MSIHIEAVDWSSGQQSLMAIRHAVFVEEQGVPADLEHDAHDAAALHLLASAPDGAPVATARLLVNGHIGRMAVLAAWRGQGIGGRLLQMLIDIAGRRGQRTVFLNAQCHAEPFYHRHGFASVGEVFDDAGIPHRRMELHLTQDAG